MAILSCQRHNSWHILYAVVKRNVRLTVKTSKKTEDELKKYVWVKHFDDDTASEYSVTTTFLCSQVLMVSTFKVSKSTLEVLSSQNSMYKQTNPSNAVEVISGSHDLICKIVSPTKEKDFTYLVAILTTSDEVSCMQIELIKLSFHRLFRVLFF